MKDIEKIIKDSGNSWKDILIFMLDSDEAADSIKAMSDAYVFEDELTDEQIDSMRKYIENKTRSVLGFLNY